MRIERTGPVEPLTPRVERFLRDRLSGQSLDDLQSANTRRADFLCLRGLLAIEVKSLEDSATERMDNLFDELRQRADWPMFLGSAPAESFIKNMENPESVRRDVLERVGRGVINPLKKANRQLEAHVASYPDRPVVRVLLLINEDNEIYDPHTVSYVLWHAVRRQRDGRPMYEHVDGILYLTERHATVVNNKVGFPIVNVEGPAIHDAPWKGEVLQLLVDRWGAYSYDEGFQTEDVASFSTIDHIPEMAPRHERWRTEYRRNPYLRPLTKVQLRDRFDEVMLLATVPMLKETPLKLPIEGQTLAMECFTHMMLEMAERAIPVTDFQHDANRAVAAAKRLNLAPSVVSWIAAFEASVEEQRNAGK